MHLDAATFLVFYWGLRGLVWTGTVASVILIARIVWAIGRNIANPSPPTG